MTVIRLAAILLVLAFPTASCEPWRAFPAAEASPAADWSVVLNQSGGFAGVDLHISVHGGGEMVAVDERRGRTVSAPLSPADISELHELIARTKLEGEAGRPSVCADCFVYDLTIIMPGGTTRWVGDDTSLERSGARELIGRLIILRDQLLSNST